jgi:hypothetical protein
LLGLGFLPGGLFISAVMVIWIYQALRLCWQGDGFIALCFALVFAAVGVLMLGGGLATAAAGLLLLAGHSEIELRDGMLITIDRCGPIRWTRKRPAAGLRRFVVTEAVRPSPHRERSLGIGDLGTIRPEWQPDANQPTPRPFYLAPGYPRSVHLALARVLAERCQLMSAEPSAQVAAAKAIEVVEPSARDLNVSDVNARPAKSDVIVDASAAALTLTVPPLGIRRGGGFFFLFGLIWCAIITVILLAVLGLGPPAGGESLWGPLAIVALFELVGVAFLLIGIHFGRRQAVLAVVGDELQILQIGLFGSKRRQFSRQDVGDIRVGPSWLVENETPVLELQIHPYMGKGNPYGLLMNRNADELRWMATLLRQRLLSGTAAAAVPTADTRLVPFHERGEQPAGSDVVMEQSAGSVTLRVPPTGIWRSNKASLLAGIIWCSTFAVGNFFLLTSGVLPRDIPVPMLLFAGIFDLIFSAAGLIAIGQAVYLGRREAVLALVGDELMVLQTSPLGSKRNQWHRAEVADVGVGMGQMVMNNQPTIELQVLPRSGAPVGLLTGRDAAELEWIATVLRRALRMPPRK